jgi:hypothetical protein
LLSGLAGLGLFILAKNEASERDRLHEQAKTETDPAKKSALDASACCGSKSHDAAAKNDQLIAIILGSGAAVLVGVGAVLYFTAPKLKEKAAASKVVPLLGPGFAGVGLGGTF